MYNKIIKFFTKDEEKSDFAEFFLKPINEQKKVIKAVVKEANELTLHPNDLAHVLRSVNQVLAFGWPKR